MYEELNCFEEALKHFGTRVEVICAMEFSNRISSEDAYIIDRNIDVHIRSIRKKLDKQRDLIETIHRVGYRFRDEEAG